MKAWCRGKRPAKKGQSPFPDKGQPHCPIVYLTITRPFTGLLRHSRRRAEGRFAGESCFFLPGVASSADHSIPASGLEIPDSGMMGRTAAGRIQYEQSSSKCRRRSASARALHGRSARRRRGGRPQQQPKNNFGVCGRGPCAPPAPLPRGERGVIAGRPLTETAGRTDSIGPPCFGSIGPRRGLGRTADVHLEGPVAAGGSVVDDRRVGRVPGLPSALGPSQLPHVSAGAAAAGISGAIWPAKVRL